MSTKFSCRFCKEQFDVPKGLYKHLQTAHNAGISRDNRTCPICGVSCSKYESYRDHLLYIHGQSEDGLKLTFKTLNEFLVWKTELELKHDCKYVLQVSPKVLPSKEKKYFYQCDRSNSKSNSKKSSVVMKTCSSVISVVEGTGAFRVEYWDSHSNHDEAPPMSSASAQSELEAAINSVEMGNEIAESDDSFDRTEDILMMQGSNSTLLNVERQGFVSKNNFPANVNNSPKGNTTPKTKTLQSFPKFDSTKKKNANTSVLFSLASVACGKGIAKKPSNKLNDDKNAGNQSKSELEISFENMSENSSKTLAGISMMKKDNAKSQESATTNKSVSEESKVNITTTMPSSILVTNKTPSSKFISSMLTAKDSENSLTNMTTSSNSGKSLTNKTTSSNSGNSLINKTNSVTPIMPKLTTVSSNSMNSLYAANSAFSNQLVIMNPVGIDQNSLNSNQNILFSLGPVGQNVVPTTTTSEIVNSESSKGDKKAVYSDNAKVTKSDTSLTGNVSNTVSSTKITTVGSDSATSTMVSSITANSSITLAPSLNNAPVILSSLPVGSTFMSVNNNLIPIASPSGAFIPTSLPPNIVLTPVMPGSSLANIESSKSTSQTQARYTTPSSVAITVSSIVKEPLYTSSVAMSSVSSTKNARTKTQNKFVPITSAGKVSPDKSSNKSPTISKGTFNLSPGKNLPNAVAEINLASYSPKSSARKKISRGIKSTSEISSNPIVNIATNADASVSTKVVNSQLSLTPISSTPNVTISPQISLHKPGTVLFQSGGDVFMLEPIDNDANLIHNDNSPHITIRPSRHNNVEAVSPFKSFPAPKSIKIDRAMQTNESFSNSTAMKSKLQRKRAAPPTDDSAVMLKVKCYQLEMKYMNSQTECKRLKVELTKERLKNVELKGDNTLTNIEDEPVSESPRTNATEIMKEIEEKFSETKDVNIYTMTKTSVLRSLYEDLEELCIENGELYKELENYRAHDKFYQSLKKKLYDEEF